MQTRIATKEEFLKECKKIQNSFCFEMIDAAKIISTHDAEGLVATKWNFAFFTNLLLSETFERNVRQYIHGLVESFNAEQFKEIFSSDYPNDKTKLSIDPSPETNSDPEDLRNLFKSPKEVAGPAFIQCEHFGIIKNHQFIDGKFYNFDEPLKLLFKIECLHQACLLNKLEMKELCVYFEIVTNEIKSWENILHNNPRSLATDLPKVSLPRKIANILLGKEMISLFEQITILLKTLTDPITAIFKKDFADGFSFKSGLKLSTILFKVINPFLLVFPITLIRSFINLPLRLFHTFISLITKKDTLARKRIFKALSYISNFLNIILLSPIKVLASCIVYPVTFLISCTSGLLFYPVILTAIRSPAKLIAKLFTSTPKPQLKSLLIKLQTNIQKNQTQHSYDKVSINKKKISLTLLKDEMKLLTEKKL